MIKIGIVGATGYAGAQLVEILARHPEAEPVFLGSRAYAGVRFSDVYGNMRGITDMVCEDDSDTGFIRDLAEKADVIFTATPQGVCATYIDEDILSKTRIIDLSADFRIKDVSVYEKWYGIKHACPEFLNEAVYGLCEVNRSLIRDARLVANPGCYTTCSILTAYPLVKAGLIDPATLIIDAKSGTTGAGRGAKVANLYCEVNETLRPYSVASHRHTPEIEEQLGYACGHDITVSFTPHLVPMNRGILVTEYATLVRDADGNLPTEEEIREVYITEFGDEHFIRLLDPGVLPETRWVEHSNYTDIGFRIDERTGRIIMMGVLDNIVKGAAGQAVQNMNIMFGFDEDTGL